MVQNSSLFTTGRWYHIVFVADYAKGRLTAYRDGVAFYDALTTTGAIPGTPGEIWIGGTPSAYLIDRWGRPSREFTSSHLPLGILGNAEMDAEPVRFTWDPESQLILGSDGLYEADNAAGLQFGSARLLETIAHTSPGERFQAILDALHQHLGGNRAADDVSLMLISCP